MSLALSTGGGSASGRRAPERRRSRRASDLRPTTSRVKSAIFSMLGPAGPSGLAVLDLYAGTGSLGLEALRRGAASAVFVEIDTRRCEDIREALQRHGFEASGKIHRADALAVARRLEGSFDIVFVDPPYAVNPFEELLGRLAEHGALAEQSIIFLEHAVKTRLPARLPGARLVSRKVYGDTAVSVYRQESTEAATGGGG